MPRPALAILALALSLAGPALAADHEIRMLNKGADGPMVFEPAFLRVEPGDTVHFIAVDKGHNVESIDGMLPEGTGPFKGKLNQDFALTVTAPGVYGVKCLPHFTMGMVALIQAGPAPANLAAAQAVKLPKRAGERMAAAFAQAE